MATLTISTTAPQDARIVAAYGKYLGTTDGNGDPRNATAAEVKQAIINNIKQVVFDQEHKAALAAVSTGTISPT